MSGKSVISLKKLPGMSDELFSYAEAFDRYGPFGPRYYVDELHLLECESYSFSGAINTADDSYRLYFSLYAHTLLVELYSSNEGGTVIWGQEYYLKDGKEYISVDEFMKCVNKAYAEAQEFIKDWEGVSVSSRKDNRMYKDYISSLRILKASAKDNLLPFVQRFVKEESRQDGPEWENSRGGVDFSFDDRHYPRYVKRLDSHYLDGVECTISKDYEVKVSVAEIYRGQWIPSNRFVRMDESDFEDYEEFRKKLRQILNNCIQQFNRNI